MWGRFRLDIRKGLFSELAAQGGDGFTVPGGAEELCTCGTEGCRLVGMVVHHVRLDELRINNVGKDHYEAEQFSCSWPVTCPEVW